MKNNLDLFLKISGKTVTQIAEEANITRKTFYAIKNGDNIPTLVTAHNIAVALNTTVDKLFPDIKKEGEKID